MKNETENGDHHSGETHPYAVAAPDERFSDPLVGQIRALWRRRQRWHRAEKSLLLQSSAICRGFVGVNGKADKAGLENASKLLKRIEECTSTDDEIDAAISCAPLLNARNQIGKERAACEKVLAKLAKQTPCAEFIEDTKGVGLQSLAAIIGEAGDLSKYKSVSGLWKRLGLAVIGGERQRKKADAIAAKEHGYDPQRRSVMFNIGGGLIGGMGHGPRPLVGEDTSVRDDLSPYQKLFVDRLRYHAAADPEKHARKTTKEGKESFSSHAANMARRYVEKRFLRELFAEWRRLASRVTKSIHSPLDDFSAVMAEAPAAIVSQTKIKNPEPTFPPIEAEPLAGSRAKPKKTTRAATIGATSISMKPAKLTSRQPIPA